MIHKKSHLVSYLVSYLLAFVVCVTPFMSIMAAADVPSNQPVVTNDVLGDSSDDIDLFSDELEHLLGEVPDPEDSVQAAGGAASPSELKLEFRLWSITALDMTDPECGNIFGGPDHISLGGTVVSRYGTTPIAYTDLGKFCDDGRRDYYDNPWVFHTFDLQDFKHTVSVNLLMAERDKDGGKEKFLGNIVVVQKVETEDKIEEDGIPEDPADPADPTIPAPAPDPNDLKRFDQVMKENLGNAYKERSETIFEEIWNWLKGLFSTPDDMFKADAISLNYNSPDLTWKGKTTSQRGAIRLYEGTGTYRIVYDWNVIRGPAATDFVNAAAEGSTDASWGATPWNQASHKFFPLLWTKPGAAQQMSGVNIVAAHSNKCLDASSSAGLQQTSCKDTNAKSQIFTARPFGYYYQLVANHSGKCLEISGNAQANGAAVHPATCSNAKKNQRFIARSIYGTNRVQFIAAHSGKCLDVKGISTQNGATVWQWECIGKRQMNQQFLSTPPKPAPPPTPVPTPIPTPTSLPNLYLPVISGG